jgi:hypothetical protein
MMLHSYARCGKWHVAHIFGTDETAMPHLFATRDVFP